MHIRVMIALLGIICGVIYGLTMSYGSETAIVFGLLGIVQFCHHSFTKRHSRFQTFSKVSHHTHISFITGIFCLAFSIGIIRTQFIENYQSFICKEVCSFDASVISTPKINGTYQTFVVRPHAVEGMYDTIVTAPLYPQFNSGDEVHLTGVVAQPKQVMEHNSIRAFDYVSYLHIHNIGSEMFFPKVTLATTSSSSQTFLSNLQTLKSYFLSILFLHVSEPSASLASGMLFGYTSLSQELLTTFRVAGISHIIVLSGFNIAILISFVFFLLRYVPLYFRFFLAAAFVVMFVLMVGAEVSIIRATIMSFIGLAALAFGRGYTARQALLLSLLAIVLYEPEHILYDTSLHLSFLATAGIVYMSDGLQKRLHRVSSKMYREIIATTLAAYLATLPYIMYSFGTISLYALFTNLFVLPLVPLMMLVAFLILLASPFLTSIAEMFGYITTIVGGLIIFIARTFESLPFSTITVSVSLSTMILIYLGMILLWMILEYYKKENITLRENETRETKNSELLSEVMSY